MDLLCKREQSRKESQPSKRRTHCVSLTLIVLVRLASNGCGTGERSPDSSSGLESRRARVDSPFGPQYWAESGCSLYPYRLPSPARHPGHTGKEPRPQGLLILSCRGRERQGQRTGCKPSLCLGQPPPGSGCPHRGLSQEHPKSNSNAHKPTWRVPAAQSLTWGPLSLRATVLISSFFSTPDASTARKKNNNNRKQTNRGSSKHIS